MAPDKPKVDEQEVVQGKHDDRDKIYKGLCNRAVELIGADELLFISSDFELLSKRIEYSEKNGIPKLVQKVMRGLVGDSNARKQIFPKGISTPPQLEEFFMDKSLHRTPENRRFIDFICLAITSGIMGRKKESLYKNYVKKNIKNPISDALESFLRVLKIENRENMQRQGVEGLREDLENAEGNKGFFDLMFNEVASHSSMDEFGFFFREIGLTDEAGKEVRRIMEGIVEDEYSDKKEKIMGLAEEKRNSVKRIVRERKKTKQGIGAVGARFGEEAEAIKSADASGDDSNSRRVETLCGLPKPDFAELDQAEVISGGDVDPIFGEDEDTVVEAERVPFRPADKAGDTIVEANPSYESQPVTPVEPLEEAEEELSMDDLEEVEEEQAPVAGTIEPKAEQDPEAEPAVDDEEAFVDPLDGFIAENQGAIPQDAGVESLLPEGPGLVESLESFEKEPEPVAEAESGKEPEPAAEPETVASFDPNPDHTPIPIPVPMSSSGSRSKHAKSSPGTSFVPKTIPEDMYIGHAEDLASDTIPDDVNTGSAAAEPSPASDTDPDPDHTFIPTPAPIVSPGAKSEVATDPEPESAEENSDAQKPAAAISDELAKELDPEVQEILADPDPKSRKERLKAWVAENPKKTSAIVIVVLLLFGLGGLSFFKLGPFKEPKKGNIGMALASLEKKEKETIDKDNDQAKTTQDPKEPMQVAMKTPMSSPKKTTMQASMEARRKGPMKIPKEIALADKDLTGPRPIKLRSTQVLSKTPKEVMIADRDFNRTKPGKPNKPKEAKDKLEKAYKRYFKSGRYGLNWDDLMRGSSPDVPSILVDRNGVPPKRFEVTGEADKEPHRDVNNGANWYNQKLLAANALNSLEKYIDSSRFPKSKRNFGIIKVLISQPDYCSYTGLKRMISEGHASTDEIFGENGVLNFILAFQRSVSPLIKNGIAYDGLQKFFKQKKELSRALDKGSHVSKITLVLNERVVRVEEVPMHAEGTIDKDKGIKTMLATKAPARPKAFGSAPVPELEPILGSEVAFNVQDRDIVDQYPLTPPQIPEDAKPSVYDIPITNGDEVNVPDYVDMNIDGKAPKRKSVLASMPPVPPKPFGAEPLPELKPILKGIFEREAEKRKRPPEIPEDALPKITDADITEELPSTPPPIPVSNDQIVSEETIPTYGMGSAPKELKTILGAKPPPIPKDAIPSVYDIPRGETIDAPEYVSMADDRMSEVGPPPIPAMASVEKTKKGILSKVKGWFKKIA